MITRRGQRGGMIRIKTRLLRARSTASRTERASGGLREGRCALRRFNRAPTPPSPRLSCNVTWILSASSALPPPPCPRSCSAAQWSFSRSSRRYTEFWSRVVSAGAGGEGGGNNAATPRKRWCGGWLVVA